MWRRLDRKIRNYIDQRYLLSSEVQELWIIVPPLQATLLLKDLVAKQSEIREEFSERGVSNFEVKILTVDLLNMELVPIEKLGDELAKYLPKRKKKSKSVSS